MFKKRTTNVERVSLFKADDLASGNGYSKSKSPVLLAVPNKAQFASPTGNSQLEKVVSCLQP